MITSHVNAPRLNTTVNKCFRFSGKPTDELMIMYGLSLALRPIWVSFRYAGLFGCCSQSCKTVRISKQPNMSDSLDQYGFHLVDIINSLVCVFASYILTGRVKLKSEPKRSACHK